MQARTRVTLPQFAARGRSDVVWVLSIIVVATTSGLVSAGRPQLGLLVVLLAAGAAVMACRPVAVAVACLPASWLIQDVGVGPSLGVTDALLGGAALLALPALRTRAPGSGLGGVPYAGVVYLVLLLPSLLAVPSAPAVTEWVHRILLILAPLAVGAWIRQEGRVHLAIRLLVIASCFVAAICLYDSVKSGFAPAFPLGYHKNYAGSLLALTLLLVAVLPDALRRGLRLPALALLAAGTVATQSRGAMLGGVLGLLVWLFAGYGQGQRSRSTRLMSVLVAVVFAGYAVYSVQQQLTAENRTTNSVGVREDVETYTRDLWRDAPLLGVGIRYYRTDAFAGYTASNNAINSELAEAGVVGLAGFFVLHATVFCAVWRRRKDRIALAALALLAGNLLHGMFDVYWSSGLTPLPFLVAGMALHRDVQGRTAVQDEGSQRKPARA